MGTPLGGQRAIQRQVSAGHIAAPCGGDPGEDPGEDPEEDPTEEDPTEEEPPEEGPKDGYAGGDGGTTTVSGTGAPTVTAAAGGTAHIKDATPKTGVEDYGIFFLFGAILLVGGACFAYSKKLHCEK